MSNAKKPGRRSKPLLDDYATQLAASRITGASRTSIAKWVDDGSVGSRDWHGTLVIRLSDLEAKVKASSKRRRSE